MEASSHHAEAGTLMLCCVLILQRVHSLSILVALVANHKSVSMKANCEKTQHMLVGDFKADSG